MSGGRECSVCKLGGGYHLERNKPAAEKLVGAEYAPAALHVAILDASLHLVLLL